MAIDATAFLGHSCSRGTNTVPQLNRLPTPACHAQEILTFLRPVRRSHFVRAARLVAALSSLKPFCSPASMEADIGGKRAPPTADQADEQCLAAQLVQFQCIELLQSYDTRWPHCPLCVVGLCFCSANRQGLDDPPHHAPVALWPCSIAEDRELLAAGAASDGGSDDRRMSARARLAVEARLEAKLLIQTAAEMLQSYMDELEPYADDSEEEEEEEE